jgi:hypothetical protein
MTVPETLFFAKEVDRALLVEQKIRHDLFELLIFLAELAYFAQTVRSRATVLVAPAIERGLRDAQLSTNLHCGRSGLYLLERLRYLNFGVFAWSHFSVSFTSKLQKVGDLSCAVFRA